jgi:hypothetical protein
MASPRAPFDPRPLALSSNATDVKVTSLISYSLRKFTNSRSSQTLTTVAGPHGGWNWRAALGDRVLPRHRELVDAAIDLSLHADGLVQGQRVKVDLCRLRRRQ